MSIGLSLPTRIFLWASPGAIINSIVYTQVVLIQNINYMFTINHMRPDTRDSGKAKLASKSVEFPLPFQSHLVELLKINWPKRHEPLLPGAVFQPFCAKWPMVSWLGVQCWPGRDPYTCHYVARPHGFFFLFLLLTRK